MAYKVLGQLAPAAAVYTGALYTVPSAKSALVSTITVTNRGTSADTFQIRIAVANAAADNKQYLAYNTQILPGSVVPMSLGMTLSATDVVYAGSLGGNCTFQMFGDEA